MGPLLRMLVIAGALGLCAWPRTAWAGDMDLALSRLRFASRDDACVGVGPSGYCPDNEGFERLASELAVALAPAVTQGAATIGPAGFYLGISSAFTPIASDRRYWQRGTRGPSTSIDAVNSSPDSVLTWNRLELRKGLPFGFEIGALVGRGWGTSMWVLGGQLRWALLEGFRSGLGAFPDVAVRAALQTSMGSSQISLQTHALDLTLSKPFVIGQRFRLTPLLGTQALFVRAQSGRIDLTPDVDAWATCMPSTPSAGGGEPKCGGDEGDFGNDVVFTEVSHTRMRMFVGAEGQTGMISMAMSLGFDLAAPDLDLEQEGDGEDGGLSHIVSLHLALGLRY